MSQKRCSFNKVEAGSVDKMMAKKQVCIIGGGPGGMEILHQMATYSKMQGPLDKKDLPDIVCYEKQSGLGGMWNLDGRVGFDEDGEPVHGSMYYKMFINECKEYIEYADYTFEDHFQGKNLPSYMPRAVMRDYLISRWNMHDIVKSVKFDHAVRRVEFDEKSMKFRVHVTDVKTKVEKPVEVYDLIIVATGHFSTPNMPSFPGMDTFPGRVFHSHDFRHAEEFQGKSILLIGSSFSAEDLALHGIKGKAKEITITYRRPLGFNWGKFVEERPLLTRVEGKTVFFKDGSSKNFDVIVLCTGYKHHFPFMEHKLRLDNDSRLFSLPELYKGIVWKSNPGLMYMGACTRILEAQASWIIKYLMGEIELPDDLEPNIAEWVERNKEAESKGALDIMSFKNDVMQDLVKESKYHYNTNKLQMLKDIYMDKKRDPLTFRDKCYTSKYTGITAAAPKIPYIEIQDDSTETFMNSSQQNKEEKNGVLKIMSFKNDVMQNLVNEWNFM